MDVSSKENLVRFSFYITYAFLLTTATITFIEAMRTGDAKIRNILNLETCISVVAAFFYSQFVEKIKDEELNYRQINITRYTDWAITTPIMLLVLVLAFLYNIKGQPSLNFFSFLLILLFNYAMLGFGYLGELGLMDKMKSWILGMISFFALYGYIYYKYMSQKFIFDNQILYWAFFIFWICYGLIYYMDNENRNIGYNVLDLLSKCFGGIFFWAYITKVFTIN